MEICPSCHIYFAGSSEIFGNATEYPQSEKTTYNPRSVYGISKLSSHSLIKNYRERFNLFACTGFTYNHESPRRGRTFVTRKVTSAVADIVHGKQDFIELGNIQAKRDWGYAPEYVQAMYLMLQNKVPKDYVISTGNKVNHIEKSEELSYWDNLKQDVHKEVIKTLEVERIVISEEGSQNEQTRKRVSVIIDEVLRKKANV